MATMYETIMNLPLFKGLSHEQVSSFLEKTHFKFSKYSDREKIVSAGERVEEMKCVISGQIRLCHIIGDKDLLRLTELRRNHEVIGADRLFGMDTTYGADICAVGNVSTMEFSKDQYQNLLNAGSIYLLNYLNSLSYGAQIRFNILMIILKEDLLQPADVSSTLIVPKILKKFHFFSILSHLQDFAISIPILSKKKLLILKASGQSNKFQVASRLFLKKNSSKHRARSLE